MGQQLPRLVFAAVVMGTVSLVVPTIGRHIDDPNRIVYFNADEGMQMDLVWRYYSGQRRATTMTDLDYGLELRYLAALARWLPSSLVTLTPGTFVLWRRWINLSAWLLALWVLWRLVGRHVSRGWPQAIAVSLVAVRPALARLAVNGKPEPLVVLFLLLALDQALRLINQPSLRGVWKSTAWASLALIVKYVTGLFALPALVAAMEIGERQYAKTRPGVTVFPRVRSAWVLFAAIGAILIAFPLAALSGYVRHSTGMTWAAEHGLWGSLRLVKPAWLLCLMGVGCWLLPLAGWWLSGSPWSWARRLSATANRLASHAIIAWGAFAAWTLLFGVGWLVHPDQFLTTYSQLASVALATPALNVLPEQGLLRAFLDNAGQQLWKFDPVIALGGGLYVAVEWNSRRRAGTAQTIPRLKCLVLAVFLAPFLLLLVSMLRVAQHHMLPFVVVAVLLAIQGVRLIEARWPAGPRRSWTLTSLWLLAVGDIVVNGVTTAPARLYEFRHHQDASFEVARWWREHIPQDATIVADHYTRAYIEADYPNLHVFQGYRQDSVERLRQAVDTVKPQFVYYNAGPSAERPIPPLETVLSSQRVELLKTFDSAAHGYQRRPGDRFVIYRVLGS
ncbi:MAG: glycosyltransferase family 39 protein [Candidatus Omnitrophica bacterium]|nr:glycosyltransferase family 39 protein [Candidatus Omnitrophota bacterium]